VTGPRHLRTLLAAAVRPYFGVDDQLDAFAC